MRVLIPVVAAAALFGTASLAFALDATGTIKTLNMSKSMVTLDNGQSYMAPKSVDLSQFKSGDKVKIEYSKSGDKMDITSMKSM